jgi:hypothetical protein
MKLLEMKKTLVGTEPLENLNRRDYDLMITYNRNLSIIVGVNSRN